jgi:hypothetical protein
LSSCASAQLVGGSEPIFHADAPPDADPDITSSVNRRTDLRPFASIRAPFAVF